MRRTAIPAVAMVATALAGCGGSAPVSIRQATEPSPVAAPAGWRWEVLPEC